MLREAEEGWEKKKKKMFWYIQEAKWPEPEIKWQDFSGGYLNHDHYQLQHSWAPAAAAAVTHPLARKASS